MPKKLKRIDPWSPLKQAVHEVYLPVEEAKFDLFCFQRFGNRFGGAEGAAPYKA